MTAAREKQNLYSIDDVYRIIRSFGGYVACHAGGIYGKHGAFTDLYLVKGENVARLSVERFRVPRPYIDTHPCFSEASLEKTFNEIGLSLTLRTGQPEKIRREKPGMGPETFLSPKKTVELINGSGEAFVVSWNFFNGKRSPGIRFYLSVATFENPLNILKLSFTEATSLVQNKKNRYNIVPFSALQKAVRPIGLTL